MDIYLRTIPHTGTRFVVAILNYLGVKHQQWHFGWPTPLEYIEFDDKRVSLDVVPRTSETRYIVTARNPHHTWESFRFDGRWSARQCKDWHDELEAFCDSGALVFVLQLDTSDQQQALTDLAAFCGVEYDGGFTWYIDNPSGCQHDSEQSFDEAA